MERSRRTGFGVAALVALALMAAFAIGATAQGWVFASPPAQTATGSNTQQPATTADANKQAAADKEQRLMDSFIANFTSRLHVDEATLNSAFKDAVNATADKAVTDGLITQAEADEAKEMAQKGGFRGLIEHGFATNGSKPGMSGVDIAVNPKEALITAMTSIGVTMDEWQRAIEEGKSLADLAAAHNVDVATLKNMILTTYRTQLDTAVHDGKITQVQADTEYNGFAGELDKILTSTNKRVEKNPATPEP
jgi:hypothetical protein